MISGKNINLCLFQDESDVHIYLSLYNNLTERAETDHLEIYQANVSLKRFRETGFWISGSGMLLIKAKSDEIIGTISYSKTTDFELEIGYRLFEKKYRNKGYMSEALQLFSAYLFSITPHITRLKIQTAEDNTGSRKLAEKCGYKQEGLLRKAYFYRGKICNFVIYSLLREECRRFKE